MTDQRLAAVLAATGPVLLDFDGPVTHLFSNGRNRMVADRMRQALPADCQPPPDVFDTYDPLVVLRWSATHTPQDVQRTVDDAAVDGEVEAATVTEPTPGSFDLLHACHASSRAVIIVSNNADQAIHTYLDRFHLNHLVQAVVARTPGRPDLMKPHPNAINRALDILGVAPDDCCMIGDSVSDILVCQTTGVRSIGYAKNPRRGQELADVGADTLVDSMAKLARAVENSGKAVAQFPPRER